MNLCTSCGLDFSSVEAFDRHRTGAHEYLFAEGLRMNPPREDGRRCLDAEEMLEAGMELDGRGRWRIVMSEKQRAGIARMRARASAGVPVGAATAPAAASRASATVRGSVTPGRRRSGIPHPAARPSAAGGVPFFGIS